MQFSLLHTTPLILRSATNWKAFTRKSVRVSFPPVDRPPAGLLSTHPRSTVTWFPQTSRMHWASSNPQWLPWFSNRPNTLPFDCRRPDHVSPTEQKANTSYKNHRLSVIPPLNGQCATTLGEGVKLDTVSAYIPARVLRCSRQHQSRGLPRFLPHSSRWVLRRGRPEPSINSNGTRNVSPN